MSRRVLTVDEIAARKEQRSLTARANHILRRAGHGNLAPKLPAPRRAEPLPPGCRAFVLGNRKRLHLLHCALSLEVISVCGRRFSRDGRDIPLLNGLSPGQRCCRACRDEARRIEHQRRLDLEASRALTGPTGKPAMFAPGVAEPPVFSSRPKLRENWDPSDTAAEQLARGSSAPAGSAADERRG